MKILITNHWLKKPGGSETFTYTMVKAALECGHQVDLFTFHEGIVESKIRYDFGLFNRTIARNYDLVLASHNTTVDYCHQKGLGPIIQTCHGTIPKLERPSGFAHYHVAISEEIKEFHRLSVNLPMTVILNGINTDRFSDKTSINPDIRNVLSLSHSKNLNDQLAKIFKSWHIGFKALNKYVNPVWEVEKEIQKNDLVISLGRGAYESLSCGRPVLILDDRPYQALLSDGMILPHNIDSLVRYNFSGRYHRWQIPVDKLIRDQLGLYQQHNQIFYRNWSLKNLNHIQNFQKYIELWKKNKPM